jgi:hypothetical protein
VVSSFFVRGSRTIAVGNPPKSFGGGRNRLLHMRSKQVHVLGIWPIFFLLKLLHFEYSLKQLQNVVKVAKACLDEGKT